MFPDTVELAFRRFQTRRDPRALAVVFDRTAQDLLALGRHLASPGTDAEDLVQATFVTAIEDAASWRPNARVMPWLVGILSNHARAARRRSRRSPDAARLPHAVSDAAEQVAAGEVNRELRAAIDRLPEVYRPVLRLVFEHGLDSHEIARALERPAGTVRAQVSRGIEMLRRLLPASLAGAAAVTASTGRGLAAVRQHVLAAGGGSAATTPLFLGGLLMVQHKFVAATAALLALALGIWFVDLRPASAAPEPPPVPGQAVVAQAPVAPEPAPTDREVIAAANAQPANDTTTAASTDAARTGTLVVRVKSGNGTAAAGIGVAVVPIADLQNLGKNLAHVPTNAAGEVRFTGLAAGQWLIDVDRVGGVAAADTTAGETTVRDVELSPGIRVDGRVIDKRGAPVAGALVVLHAQSRSGDVQVATSDAAGTFSVQYLTNGVELQARAAGRQPSLAYMVRTGAYPSTVAVDLELGDAARTVRGRVLSATAAPLANAVVAILPATAGTLAPSDAANWQGVRANWLRTANDGTFACDEGRIGAQIVFAVASDGSHAPAWIEADTTSGDATAELRLPRGASVVGTVKRGGVPLTNVTASTWPLEEPDIGYLLNLFGTRIAQTSPTGSFRIDGLLPGPHRLQLLEGMAMLRQQRIELRDGETFEWNTDVAAGTGLSISVAGETPLGSLRLVALVTRSVIRDGDMPALVPLQSDGTCVHEAPRDAAVDVVICSLPGGANILQLAAVRGVPPGQREVRLTLAATDLPQRYIVGRLVDEQRAPLGSATVAATKVDANGLIVRLQTVTGADGSFRLGPLPAGDYVLLEGAMQSPHHAGRATLTAARDEDVGDLVIAR